MKDETDWTKASTVSRPSQISREIWCEFGKQDNHEN